MVRCVLGLVGRVRAHLSLSLSKPRWVPKSAAVLIAARKKKTLTCSSSARMPSPSRTSPGRAAAGNTGPSAGRVDLHRASSPIEEEEESNLVSNLRPSSRQQTSSPPGTSGPNDNDDDDDAGAQETGLQPLSLRRRRSPSPEYSDGLTYQSETPMAKRQQLQRFISKAGTRWDLDDEQMTKVGMFIKVIPIQTHL